MRPDVTKLVTRALAGIVGLDAAGLAIGYVLRRRSQVPPRSRGGDGGRGSFTARIEASR
jgi:hypothetical protein